MPDLIAQGQQPDQRWRRSVPPRKAVVIGRGGPWATAWDRQISRSHVEVQWKHGRLHVRRLPSATNPVFLRGKQKDSFRIKPGEQFVIGSTMFTLADEKVTIAAEERSPVTEQTYSPQFLQALRFRNADQRIDVLSRLPQIISGATSETELFVRLVSVLMSGTPRAAAVAIVVAERSGEPADGDDVTDVRVLQWDRRILSEEDFRPSRRLIAQAITTGESVLHRWTRTRDDDPQFTLSDDVDWAFCTPLSGSACRNWAVYVTGKTPDEPTRRHGDSQGLEELQDDVKFAELVGNMLSSLRQLRQLERSQASLRQFLSPVVLQAVGDANWEEVLTPRETDVSVLFCDLRGFSRESEKHADDLWNLLERVSRALGVTTRHILDENGVVGDFHGDAVMGFWGWPLEQADAPRRAAMTALAIRAEFEAAAHRAGHPLADFRIGIGIASGRAVAGKIGTADQVTVTVFGPVVNLAARLESMTKFMHAPILLDETSAAVVRECLPPSVARVRRVARVRPYGLNQPIIVNELLPSADELPYLSDDDVALFEKAAAAMFGFDGRIDWESSFELLHRVPAEDRTKDFLTVYMAHHNRTPPPDWEGVISLERK